MMSMLRTSTIRPLLIASLAALVTACSVNPVTGERELSLISEAQEIRIGEQNYQVLLQSQGGPYRVDPAVERYVAEVGQRLAAVSDRPDLPYEFTVVNDATPNAWALPAGKIGINRGLLLDLDSEAELAAVLGHEIVHAAARHSAQQMQRSILLQAGVAAVAAAASDEPYAPLAAGGAAVGATLLTQSYSREAELEADRYGMRYLKAAGYDPEAAVTLQQTFVELSKARNPNWLEGLFASHPPSQARVEANRRIARELGPGGERYRERYQRMIAALRKDEPAYEGYQKGVHALTEEDYAAARRQAEQALAIQPKEALFHILKGEALHRQGELAAAAASFERAITYNPDYFNAYLGAGRTLLSLGQSRRARDYLARSVDLLPTAAGYLYLGDAAIAEGEREAAVAYWQQAASSDSPAGQAARARLNELGAGPPEGAGTSR